MRALSRFPQRPSGKTTRTTSSSLRKRRTTALKSTAKWSELAESLVRQWLTKRGEAFRAAAIAATMFGPLAGSVVAQQALPPLRQPTAAGASSRPNWSQDRDANLPAARDASAAVLPAGASQSIPSALVPRSTTGELGQDSDFAANGSRLDWRPRLSAAERVKQQVAARKEAAEANESVASNDPFRDPFGDAKTIRPVADWSEENSLRGQVQPALGAAQARRGAVVHADVEKEAKSVLVAQNAADALPAPPAVVTEDLVAPLGPPRTTFAQGAPAAPNPNEIEEADPLPAPTMLPPAGPGAPADETVEDHLRRCDAVAEFSRSNRLSGISLDLTPPFAPSLTRGDGAEREDPAVALADEPARAWTNRGGAVLAEGRLIGFENGLVKIDTGSGVQQIRHRDLSEEDLWYLGRLWRIPAECTLRDEMLLARAFEPTTFTWKASALCHKPLYFEETQLERYGHTAGPIAQPIISGAHFFVNIATLPYNMGVAPPNECQYVLGYYRPGSCAPWMIEPVPISLRGAALQAGAVVGGVAILP